MVQSRLRFVSELSWLRTTGGNELDGTVMPSTPGSQNGSRSQLQIVLHGPTSQSAASIDGE